MSLFTFANSSKAEPYLSINVGTGDVKEALSWVEYCNSDKDTDLTQQRRANGNAAPFGVRYWGVGNENWGCGGLYNPEDYAKEYLRYAMYLKHWLWPSKGISTVPLELIAAGHTAPDLEPEVHAKGQRLAALNRSSFDSPLPAN